jgi:hypothetical protein
MIHYHGTPITPESAAAEILAGRHAMISFAHQATLPVAMEVCHDFTIDNGAFSAWKVGRAVNWGEYYEWIREVRRCPGFAWAVIPDVIDGTEAENDELVDQWPFGPDGVPVWHLHESIERLHALANKWPRVALGSSGEYATIGTTRRWGRIADAMSVVTDMQGRPSVKLHGLRMLDPEVFSRIPFASADSTNVARNIGIDSRWRGTYLPPDKATRGLVLARRIESVNGAGRWVGPPVQMELAA